MRMAAAAEAMSAEAFGTGKIVDVRDPEKYAEGHYPGAWRASSDAELLALPRDRLLFLYCT